MDLEFGMWFQQQKMKRTTFWSTWMLNNEWLIMNLKVGSVEKKKYC